MRMKLSILGMIVFLLLGALSGAGCSRSEGTVQAEKNRSEEQRTVQVSITEVRPVPIRDILALPAQTEAWQDVKVASDAPGRVEWVGPREGERVKKGQVLAKVDVSALKAALDRARAAFNLAEDLYGRRKQLFERKIIHQEDLDRSFTERTLAEANLRQARIEYERGFTQAPINGFVNYLYVDEGEFVDRGKPVADLVDLDKIKIQVDVPEMDVRYIKVGQTVGVRIDALPELELTGMVDFVAYKADPATRTFQVRVIISNTEHRVRPGMIARVVFLRRVIAEALVAPLFALVEKSGERMVFVEKDGVVHARTVSLGVIEGERIQITKGLNPGDHLIVAGQSMIEEGTRVEVR
ncbi:MAG: efflux RND transporter periplasmic adaptor subunit [Deltaproteobacteria bacterium]|nr:efflux RND transporter periplasmic adaptor subunit [Deltaproteobacteria bacterium]